MLKWDCEIPAVVGLVLGLRATGTCVMFGLLCLLVRVTLGSLFVLCGGPSVLAQDEPLCTTTS